MTSEKSHGKTDQGAGAKKPSRWPIVLTTVISIIITIAVGWYTISRTGREIALAEMEKVKNVKENLVAIIEEHIINEKCIDNTRLARLIDLKTRSESLKTRISTRELIEEAEYNILNSRYLDFNNKERYKGLFDEFYRAQGTFDIEKFKNSPYRELLNGLAKAISDGNKQEAFNLLARINEAYTEDLNRLKVRGKPPGGTIYLLLQNPYFIIFVFVYFGFLYLVVFRRLLRRRTAR